MPHLKRSLALIYAVNPIGADHMSSEHDAAYEDAYPYYQKRLASLGLKEPQRPYSLNRQKVAFARKTQHLSGAVDSLCLCQFVWGPTWHLYGPEEIVKLVNSVTGWEVTISEILALGERRLNMMRVFNVREGINREHDRLPEKFYRKSLQGGPSDGWKIDKSEIEAALEEYYRQSGWDIESGSPTPQTLAQLDLKWLA
jgi:aldehyde:ferredoxin oxidoreductase